MSSTGQATPRQQFLDAYEREHQTTMKVLRAFPPDKSELRPHHKCKNARELAWVFAQERGLGTAAMHDKVAEGMSAGLPAAPEDWGQVLAAVEKAHGDYGNLIRGLSDEEFLAPVKFMAGPAKFADFPRMQIAWMLLCDEIHHRGQFSIYLRMADGRVPSIYGPTADEPWY
jgi:hypothetical protein